MNAFGEPMPWVEDISRRKKGKADRVPLNIPFWIPNVLKNALPCKTKGVEQRVITNIYAAYIKSGVDLKTDDSIKNEKSYFFRRR